MLIPLYYIFFFLRMLNTCVMCVMSATPIFMANIQYFKPDVVNIDKSLKVSLGNKELFL